MVSLMLPQSDAEARRTSHQEGMKPWRDSARQWWDSGRRYYIVQLPLGGTVAGTMSQTEMPGADASAILEVIEKVGWALHDIGYVYQPLMERSHALTDSAHMVGNLVGIYTFVRPQVPPTPPT
jgi:hypothetical protein